MKQHILTRILIAAALTSCGTKIKNKSVLEFDAAHSIALDGEVSTGRILSKSNDNKVLESEIRSQLLYAVGNLNGVNGVARLSLNKVEILSKTPLADGINEVAYTSKFLVAWDRFRQVPLSFDLVLPAYGDQEHLLAFLNRFKNQCINADGVQHGVDLGTYWYYYRPMNCGLSRIADNRTISVFPIKLAMSKENTSGKSPEYGKIWEDGRLTATLIFAKYEMDSRSDADPGIAAYNSMYWSLVRRLGYPTTTNVRLPQNRSPGAFYPDLKMVFQSTRGPVDVELLLVDDITGVDEKFKEIYNERSKISDFIGYSGHSGLGANVQAMANLGKFVQGKYQLFMLNGCDSFAYADHTLRDAHAAVNPNASPNKYFDLITNSMPSYFNFNAMSNMNVLNALIESRATYRQILSTFDINQRAVVTGEEDNN